MKKLSLFSAALCVVVAGLLASCSKFYGEPVTKEYPVEGAYTKIDISDAFDVTVSDSITEAVVTVPEELHKKLKFQVVDGVLEIGYTSNTAFVNYNATVLLPGNPQLKDLELSGASSFRGDLNGSSSEIDISGASNFYGNINAAKVEFEVSGASDAYIFSISADEVEAEISGSSNLTLFGACTGAMDIEVSGASNLRAAACATDSVSGKVSGASNADVTVCNLIKVDLSGASDLTYGTSSPDCRPDYRCSTSGASKVSRRD